MVIMLGMSLHAIKCGVDCLKHNLIIYMPVQGPIKITGPPRNVSHMFSLIFVRHVHNNPLHTGMCHGGFHSVMLYTL